MTWVAVGSAAIGAGASIYSSGRAASASRNASGQNIAEQRRQFDQLQQNQQPYMQFGQGQGGIGGLSQLMGGDYSGFMKSPDYMAARDAMTYGQDHSAAAKGRLFSGGYLADLSSAQGNLAAGYLGNYRGALQWGANLGQNAAAGVGQAGQYMANQNGASRNSAADAAGTAYGAQGAAIGSLASAFANNYNTRPANAGNFGVPMPGSGSGGGTNYGSGSTGGWRW